MDSIVITGASTGIGRATTKALLDRGFRVFGSVRKQSDADRLARELGSNFSPLVFDITDEAAAQAAAAEVAKTLGNQTLAGLVNNAGVAVSGPLLDLPVSEMRRQMEVNLIGPLTVTKAFAPLLGADRARKGKPGRIVMISSTGGRRAFPFMGPYSASKFALEGMSEALRREFMLFGIDVIIVAPGATVTPIWDKAEAKEEDDARSPYAPALAKGMQMMLTEARNGLPPERVARVVADALAIKSPKTRYTITPQPFMDFIIDLLPKRMLDQEIAQRLGLKPPKAG